MKFNNVRLLDESDTTSGDEEESDYDSTFNSINIENATIDTIIIDTTTTETTTTETTTTETTTIETTIVTEGGNQTIIERKSSSGLSAGAICAIAIPSIASTFRSRCCCCFNKRRSYCCLWWCC